MQSELVATKFSLEQVEGQPVAIRYLNNYAKNREKLPPLLIFHGPSGVGKNFAAERFIFQILCFKGTGCGQCQSCISFFKKSHPDFIAFPEGEKIAIGEEKDPKEFTVRWLQSQRIIYTPVFPSFRIIFIPDATKINGEAETALLKTLEESPPHTRFIFMADDIRRLKATITSRAVLVPFQYLPKVTLHKIAEQQNLYLHDFQGGSLDFNFMEPETWEEYITMVKNHSFDSILLLKLETWIKEHKTKHPDWKTEFDYKRFLELISSLMIYEYSVNQERDYKDAIESLFEYKEWLHKDINGMDSFLLSKLFSKLCHIIQ
jgi:DNA polymerase-3 subunit gamma/tau